MVPLEGTGLAAGGPGSSNIQQHLPKGHRLWVGSEFCLPTWKPTRLQKGQRGMLWAHAVFGYKPPPASGTLCPLRITYPCTPYSSF